MTKDVAFIVELLRLINKYQLIVISACLVYYIIISISLYFIYLQIGKKKKNALIPIVNIISLLDLVSLPRLLIILIFIPYINFIGIFVASLLINYRLGKALNLSFLNKLGLIILPIIFMPIIASKHLEYTPLPPSRKLKEDVIEEEEEEEFVLDIKYDVKSVEVTSAYDVTKFMNDGLYKEDNKVVEQEEIENEVADLTFDYNDLYNIKKENNEELKEEELEDMNNDMYNQTPQMNGAVNMNNNIYNNQMAQQPYVQNYGMQQMAAVPNAGQMQYQQVPVQNQYVPGAQAQVQMPVNPGVSTPNGPTNGVVQPVPQQVVEPYSPSQGIEAYNTNYGATYNTPAVNSDFNPGGQNLVTNTVPMVDENNIDTLQMAAPPIFEEQPKVEEVTPTANPVVYTPPVEDLVSVNIMEPDALPVGNSVKNSLDEPFEVNDLMSSTPMNDTNFNLFNPVIDNSQFNNPVQFNGNSNINNTFNSGFDNNTSYQSTGRFISEEPKEYPMHDYNQQQLTNLDPTIMSNPMSIFGSSTGLRPTSDESLRGPQMAQQSGNDVCPNCGFLVKSGQPSCVVCGYRFQ